MESSFDKWSEQRKMALLLPRTFAFSCLPCGFWTIARNAGTRILHSLDTSVTFPLHVLHVLLREPIVVQTLTLVTSLP